MGERDGVTRIAEERRRQVEKLGWSASHDDAHEGDLALVASLYAASAAGETLYAEYPFANGKSFSDPWPQSWVDARPYDGNVLREPTTDEAIRLLEKAGALIAAEIDRLLQCKAKSGENTK